MSLIAKLLDLPNSKGRFRSAPVERIVAEGGGAISAPTGFSSHSATNALPRPGKSHKGGVRVIELNRGAPVPGQVILAITSS